MRKKFDANTDRLFSFKLVVIGGGAGGCSTAAKFASKLGKGNVAVIEPRDVSCDIVVSLTITGCLVVAEALKTGYRLSFLYPLGLWHRDRSICIDR